MRALPVLFFWAALMAAAFFSRTASAQPAGATDLFEQQQKKMEELRADSERRMQEMRHRHSQTIDRMRGDQGQAFESAVERSNQRMEEMKADAEAFRRSPSSALERMGVSEGQALKDFEELDRKKQQQASSESGGGYRIRGRTVRGLIILLGVLGAGVMKVFGFFNGKKT